MADPIPVTCFTGFLGAGKTSTILGLLGQLPTDYRVVLLKNEYGDVEVDSLLAKQGAIAGVSEILNGCMCLRPRVHPKEENAFATRGYQIQTLDDLSAVNHWVVLAGTLVGQIQNAMIEIRDTMKPDRIIIESSGSAFPATLAIQIRQLAPEGFALDSVVTVIDCLNFAGYEDTSPTAKIQAKYTDCLLLNKHDLCTERQLDTVLDHLYELNDETPVIRVSKNAPLDPSLIFGLDTKLFARGAEEVADWEAIGGAGKSHVDEVETRSVWRGGARPGAKTHKHDDACGCDSVHEAGKVADGPAQAIDEELLRTELAKLPFEIYRVKGFLRLPSKDSPTETHIHILNWAFGRHELTPAPTLDASPDMEHVTFRLTMMGARGEVARRARQLASALEGEFA